MLTRRTPCLVVAALTVLTGAALAQPGSVIIIDTEPEGVAGLDARTDPRLTALWTSPPAGLVGVPAPSLTPSPAPDLGGVGTLPEWAIARPDPSLTRTIGLIDRIAPRPPATPNPTPVLRDPALLAGRPQGSLSADLAIPPFDQAVLFERLDSANGAATPTLGPIAPPPRPLLRPATLSLPAGPAALGIDPPTEPPPASAPPPSLLDPNLRNAHPGGYVRHLGAIRGETPVNGVTVEIETSAAEVRTSSADPATVTVTVSLRDVPRGPLVDGAEAAASRVIGLALRVGAREIGRGATVSNVALSDQLSPIAPADIFVTDGGVTVTAIAGVFDGFTGFEGELFSFDYTAPVDHEVTFVATTHVPRYAGGLADANTPGAVYEGVDVGEGVPDLRALRVAANTATVSFVNPSPGTAAVGVASALLVTRRRR